MLRIGLAIGAALAASPAFGCSVPVFRYALELWAPSPYQLSVYHRGPMSRTDRAVLDRITTAARQANVRLTSIDLDAGDSDQAAVWARDGKNVSLPGVLLRYPDSTPDAKSLWAGPLAAEAVLSLFDSPARRAVFDRLSLGNAAVIVLLLSGDRQADDAARAMLAQELPRIAARIELPARTDDGPQIQSELPIRVQFPVVEVARGPEEDLFVRMLLGSDDGLDRVRGPIAFPVFGRGRALCSLHGKDLEKPGELQRSLEYLCRACSCQVKELNPGVDLLVAGDWDRIFEVETGPMPRAVGPEVAESRPAVRGPGRSELRSRPPDGYDPVEWAEGSRSSGTGRPWLRYGALAALVLVGVTGFRAVRGRRPIPSEPS